MNELGWDARAANRAHTEILEQSADIDRLHTPLGWVDAAALDRIRQAQAFPRRLRRCNSEQEFQRLADRIEAFARR